MTIHVHALEFETIIGMLAHERTTPQKVRVYCDLVHTHGFVDYAKAADIIKSNIIQNRYEKVEEALEGVANALYENFGVLERMELSIYKPEILSDCLVGATKKFNFF